MREGEKIKKTETKKQREGGTDGEKREKENVCGGAERETEVGDLKEMKEPKERKEFDKRMEREEKLGSTERGASTREEQ